MCFAMQARAEDVGLPLVRKMAVFPIADANVGSAEDAWWQLREVLTRDQKFLVASRRFMINRGVFQPRKNLKPADVIILGKILDAESIMTTVLVDRKLKSTVYLAENGSPIWESELELHPAIPVADQLIRASQKMAQDFIWALPYQGFQLLDDSIGKSVYQMDGTDRAMIFHGLSSGLEVGDQVQWVRSFSDPGRPMLGVGNRIEIIAEGKILSIQGNQAEVQILKARDLKELSTESLVRFPKELEKLKALYAKEKGASLEAEYLGAELKTTSELRAGHSSTSTALAFLGNIALMVLLAF